MKIKEQVGDRACSCENIHPLSLEMLAEHMV